MKDSKEYSKKIQKLYRSLKRKGPRAANVTYEDPIDALVYAVVSEHITEKQAQTAFKNFTSYFLDLNDLRVSRPEEIMELLGEDKILTRQITLNLKKALQKIFDTHNIVSLIDLKKMGKRPVKETLEKIEGLSSFSVNYCMLTAFGGHSIPLTGKMLEYLKSGEYVHPQATEEEIEGFLTRQIPAKNGYEFYTLLRKASESEKKRQKITSTGTEPEKKKKETKQKPEDNS